MSELQGRELDAALARALGYFVDDIRMYPVSGQYIICSHYKALPHYSLSLDSMHDVEDELIARELHGEYTNLLMEIVWRVSLDRCGAYSADGGQIFDIVHATAEQKARAALAVLTSK